MVGIVGLQPTSVPLWEEGSIIKLNSYKVGSAGFSPTTSFSRKF